MSVTNDLEFAFLDSLDIDIDVKDRLSQHLKRTYNGRDDILLTPIAKDNSPQLILSEFDKVFNSNKDKMNNTLLNLEVSNRDKFGPRSLAKPWKDRVESLVASFGSDNHDMSSILTLRGNNRLRPLKLDTAVKLLKNNTNSGLPYYTKKGVVKERVLLKFDTLLKRKDPCILFTRTQEQSKTRNVWGFPIADTLNEMRYYSPLLSYQKNLAYRAALVSPDEVGRKMTALILKAKRLGYSLVSIDFAAYDTTVKRKLQKVAFDYIKSLFQRESESDIQYIAERFGSIGIITPDGVYSGEHGVPSGSTFTNEVDSIVQSSISMSLPFIGTEDFQVQGDDGVYLVPSIHVDKLIELFESCGLKVSRDKSYTSDNYAVYLQNLYHIDYIKDGFIGGIYPVYRALNRILYQERWSDFEDYGIIGKDYYSIRTICILENCKHHPLFQELVKFVLKYDKYSLATSKSGIANYVQMISKTNGAGEILNHQYGDNVSGIRSFQSFRLIKELS